MKWKEIIIGALATLLVTILGGVGVFYWTKEPDEKKTELLYYTVNQVASFRGGAANLGLNVARIHNDGGVSAKEVTLTIQFPTATITDYSIDSISEVIPKSKKIDKQKAVFIFDALVPKESITISLLTSSPEVPNIILRSNDSIGEADGGKSSSDSSKRKVNKFVEYLILFLGVSSILLSFPVFRFIFRSYQRTGSSKNDMAFLLLHQGLINDAEIILNDAVGQGEDGSFSLSNLAVCKAKNGQLPDALSLIRAARFYSDSKHEYAVVAFNDALISLIAGDKEEFFLKIKDAVEKSPKIIRSYCDFSVYLTDVKSESRYADLFKKT